MNTICIPSLPNEAKIDFIYKFYSIRDCPFNYYKSQDGLYTLCKLNNNNYIAKNKRGDISKNVTNVNTPGMVECLFPLCLDNLGFCSDPNSVLTKKES